MDVKMWRKFHDRVYPIDHTDLFKQRDFVIHIFFRLPHIAKETIVHNICANSGW